MSVKTTDSKSVKAMNYIYQVFQEYPEKINQFKFVAADLKSLPQIPYECVDASGLFSSYKKLENEVEIIKDCSKSSESMFKGIVEAQNSVLERLSALETKLSTRDRKPDKPFQCSECD